jgi:hypothetical protein
MSAHKQANAIQNPPPASVIHLFRHIPENREQRYAAVTRGFGIARTVIEASIRDLLVIQAEGDDISNMLNTLIQRNASNQQRILSLRQALEAQHIIARGEEEAMVAEENPIASMIANAIVDTM